MKIFLADPHPQVRSALHLVLSQIAGVSVMGETGDVSELLAQSSQECPDLILLDMELVEPCRFHRRRNRQQPMDIISAIHKICPSVKVVVMSSRLEGELEALDAGADGFFSKTEPPEIFCEKIARLWINKERRSSK